MSDTTAALADTSALPDFEGLSVRQTGIEIPGAAGGLRDPMKVEPQAWHKGEEVHVVLKCVVDKVRFDAIDKENPTGDQRRVHVFQVEAATIVEGSLVADALAEQGRRITSAKEAAAGVGRLPYDDEAEKAHGEGLHASGLVPGCPSCDAEARAVADEEG